MYHPRAGEPIRRTDPHKHTQNQGNADIFMFLKCFTCTCNIQLIYHGYCKDQRDAAVIILRYTTLCHNGLWEVPVIHLSLFGTWWKNLSFETQNHVNYMQNSRFCFSVDIVYFILACTISFFMWIVAIPNEPPSVITFRWLDLSKQQN